MNTPPSTNPLVMKRRALVIDDEEDMRELARVFLELDGEFDVRVAVSGKEGIDLARRELPDVILLDYMMPGMDGPATMKELSRDAATASIPVIFLTAKSQPDVEQTLRQLGARDVIAKPFDPVALAGKIAAALESS
jgi:CheY-like chemotaxis protein